MKKYQSRLLLWSLVLCLLLSGCNMTLPEPSAAETSTPIIQTVFSLDSIPEFTTEPYATVNQNQPYFTDADLQQDVFESYSALDSMGRCGPAYAMICKELMPTEERGEIGQVKPTGWHLVKYDCVDGKYLYNRCHLIGFQLAGENANEKNLITGTRYLNVTGMLPFENEIADYVKETGNHVLYRVTPIYEGENQLATGVLMEASSIEDNGAGVRFNVFCYNNQPGVTINLANGDNEAAAADPSVSPAESQSPISADYILNTHTKKFHLPNCSSSKDIKEGNKKAFTGSRDSLISDGYEPCGRCKP